MTIQQYAESIGKTVGEVSDGYHTFNELYEHRIVLYIKLCQTEHNHGSYSCWRSKKHSDGSKWDGWFLLGIGKSVGCQITYHLPIKYWDECGFAETIEQAPQFDGHTSADVLKRIQEL